MVTAERPLASFVLPPKPTALPCEAQTIEWDEFASDSAAAPQPPLRVFRTGTLNLRITLGRAAIDPSSATTLRSGSVVLLDRAVADPVEIHADGQLIARGEVLAIDGKLAVRILEIVMR
jgi:flagellar motor switch protein FliN/FliY